MVTPFSPHTCYFCFFIPNSSFVEDLPILFPPKKRSAYMDLNILLLEDPCHPFLCGLFGWRRKGGGFCLWVKGCNLLGEMKMGLLKTSSPGFQFVTALLYFTWWGFFLDFKDALCFGSLFIIFCYLPFVIFTWYGYFNIFFYLSLQSRSC